MNNSLARWPGHACLLSAGVVPNNLLTIVIASAGAIRAITQAPTKTPPPPEEEEHLDTAPVTKRDFAARENPCYHLPRQAS